RSDRRVGCLPRTRRIAYKRTLRVGRLHRSSPRGGSVLNRVQARNRRKSLSSSYMRRCLQQRDFFRIEKTVLAGIDVELEAAVANALNLLDVMTHLFEHPSKLAVASLDQRDFVPRVRGVLDECDPCWSRFDSSPFLVGDKNAGT